MPTDATISYRDAANIWQWLHRLFAAMNEGRAFGDHQINQFNGGLFAPDPELDQRRKRFRELRDKPEEQLTAEEKVELANLRGRCFGRYSLRDAGA